MPRHVIKTVNHRAEDLELDDIVKLRIHNRIQWVLLTRDAEKIRDQDTRVKLTYLGPIASTSIDVGRYELVPVQIEVEA
jgi:hypothetical protein